MQDFDARVSARSQLLIDSARAAGYWISGDFRVSEADAAALIGVSAGGLRRWRSEGNSPHATHLNGRITYCLEDVARWIELGREVDSPNRTNPHTSAHERTKPGSEKKRARAA